MNKIRMLLPIGFFAIILFGLVSHVSITDSKVSDMENRTLEKAPLEPTVNELLSGGWFRCNPSGFGVRVIFIIEVSLPHCQFHLNERS